MLPKYHHIDEGTPPRVNAARPPGEWQSLDVTFRAPRFARDGTKVENARFVKVVLNGQVIHENVDVKSPTGHVWRLTEDRQGADPAPGRPRAGGVPQDPGAAAM